MGARYAELQQLATEIFIGPLGFWCGLAALILLVGWTFWRAGGGE